MGSLIMSIEMLAHLGIRLYLEGFSVRRHGQSWVLGQDQATQEGSNL